MLSEFVRENRGEIIERCRVRVAARMAPRPTESELEHGIPLFLDQLTATLHSKLVVSGEPGASAVIHGKSMLRRGFTIGQVVQDYGDVCQTITEIALEQTATITVDEFRTLNMCLDEAIASAVGEFGRQQAIDVAASGAERATKDLGFLAHELRNLIATATLAFDALWNGSGAITGSTGAVLGRTLKSLGHLVDRSLAVVRLDAGVLSRETIVIGDLIQEIEVTATLEAKVRLHQLTIEVDDASAVVEGDRQILASIVVNLVHNAFKFTGARSHVVVRTISTSHHVRIEVEDECGGLAPGEVETMFTSLKQHGADRSGLGLGLAICQRGVDAIGGTIRVRNLPGKGCVFAVELPRTSGGN